MRSKYVPSCRTLELQLNVIYSDPLSREHFAPVLLDFHSTSALHDAGQESKSSKANTDPHNYCSNQCWKRRQQWPEAERNTIMRASDLPVCRN